MSNIMDCPYGHRFSKTRYGTICPHCGFDLDTPEKVYVNLRKECGLSLKEERPVCAWLVCIEGKRQGKAYNITAGKNYIGQNDTMNIQVLGDEDIRDKNHAVIAYDTRNLQGTLLGEESMGFVRLNESATYTSKDLKEGDILEVGKSKFFYFDFAKEYHQW